MKNFQLFVFFSCAAQLATSMDVNNDQKQNNKKENKKQFLRPPPRQKQQWENQRPPGNQQFYNPPPRQKQQWENQRLDWLEKHILNQELNSKEYVFPAEATEFGLNAEAKEFVLEEKNHSVNVMNLSDGNGNAMMLRYDGQKELAFSCSTLRLTHAGYTDGTLQFSLKGEIDIKDHVMQNAEVTFKYLAFKFTSKYELKEYRIKLKHHQEPKVKLYKTSRNAFKLQTDQTLSVESNLADWILELIHGFKKQNFAEKRMISEYQITPYRGEQTLKLYRKPPHVLKTNRIFVAQENTYVKEIYVKKRKSQRKRKIPAYKHTKTEFGNERESKNRIPLIAKQIFIRTIECKLEYIEELLSGIVTLKTAELKQHLKEFGFTEEINRNWNRSQLMQKFTKLLKKKRDLLLIKLQVENSCAQEIKAVIPKTFKRCKENEIANEIGLTNNEEAKFKLEKSNYGDKKRNLIIPFTEDHDKILKKGLESYFGKNKLQEFKDEGTSTDSEGDSDDIDTLKDEIPSAIVECVRDMIDKNKELDEIRSIQDHILAIPHVCENMYLTENGDLLHALNGARKILFNVIDVVTHFVFKNKTYNQIKIRSDGNDIIYSTVAHDTNDPDVHFVLSYKEKGTENVPNFGNVVVVGGNPTLSMWLNNQGKWHETEYRKHEKEFETFFWPREARLEYYQKRK